MNSSAFTPYSIEHEPRRTPLVSHISKPSDEYRSVKGKNTENPLIITFGGPTGAAKTVLATLYSKEEGIKYDAIEAAKEAGINLSETELAETLKLMPGERMRVHIIPKITTRGLRHTEVNGLDLYSVDQREFDRRKEGQIFTYRYPKDGSNEYAVPASITWPLNFGVDSINTLTGYESFRKMAEIFPNSVGIVISSDARDIEGHIKGRAASEDEIRSRLESYKEDIQDFQNNRHETPYSVAIYSLKSLRMDITREREKMILQELNSPLRQIKAIVRWERYLQNKEPGIRNPQERFDYFLSQTLERVFPGTDYEEFQTRVHSGDIVRVIDRKNDAELLQDYSERRGMSMTLLEEIVDNIKVTGVLDANGRRTIVMSPYDRDYIEAIDGTSKKAIIEILSKKINGFGVHVAQEKPLEYKPSSQLSLVHFDKGVEEGLFIYLSSDHVPVIELNRPRALNFVFSTATDAQSHLGAIRKLTLDEITSLQLDLARSETPNEILRRSI